MAIPATYPAASARLRTNPDYVLELRDRLSTEEAALLDVPGGEHLFGLLRPRRDGLSYRAVDNDTALLLFTLATSGPLPAFAREKLGPDCDRVIADLVLGDVLQIERDGVFLSGPDAQSAFFPEQTAPARGRTAQLSMDALRYGARLGPLDPATLMYRLYAFNRSPLTPAWQRRLPGPDDVLAHLGLAPGGPLDRAASRSWVRHGSTGGWLSWSSRVTRAAASDFTYKLYLSPTIEALPSLMAIWLEESPRLSAFSFKVGRDASGLLRPDKFVAYFASLDDLAHAGQTLATRAAGCPAQGVPFTAGITTDGLLSWGIDPPGRVERKSWRLWVAEHAAGSLASAQARAASEPWSFALRRLQLAGVDTDSWQPSGAWRSDAEEEANVR